VSDASDRSREWRFYVQDMIGFCEKVRDYTGELDREGFVADGMVYDATLRNLELIGEAATHVPDAVREAHPEVPWRTVIGVRNRLAHGYLGINDDIVWSIVRDDIPALLPALRSLLAVTDEDS